MSSLFKLSIKGIRSFESENEETIQFGFPLTLIWGQNGCGKTTIIECLKYATTGDLPPNSKGGAFVNDPSLSGRSSVTGQIKLAFRNANGKSMITTRTVQLSRKQARGVTTNTFKTLEGQLATVDKGKRISISTKNAELDSQTPIYLGASKAILDYVIFCHQDEMLWPLSEASVLKKRFDDIFEASKFTKVLDSLKVIKKDMTTDIKLIEQSVKHLKIDKDRAKKVQDRLSQMNESIEVFAEQITDINISIEQKEREAEQLFATNQEFQKTLSDFEVLKIKKVSLEEQIERIRNSIEVLDDSHEELLNKQANFSNLIRDKQTSIDQLNDTLSDLNQELRDKTHHYNELIRLEGSLKSKEDDYNSNLKNIKELIKNHCRDYSYNSVEDIHEDINSFGSLIEKTYKHEKSSLNNLINEFKQNESLKQADLQQIVDSITREDQHLRYCAKDMESVNSELSVYTRKLDDSEVDQEQLRLKREELEKAIKDHDNKKKSNEGKDLDSKISNNKAQLTMLEFELEELSKKIAKSDEQSEIRSKISFINDSIASKVKMQNKLVSKHAPAFQNLTGNELTISTARHTFDESLSLYQKQLRDQEVKKSDSSRRLEAAKATKSAIEDSLQKHNSTIASLKERITAVITEDEISEYDSILEDLEESYRNVIEDVNTAEVTKQFNITAIKIAQVEKNCLLCKRSFEGEGLTKFVTELQNSVNKDKVKEIEVQAKEIKKELDSTKSINSDILSFQSVNTTVVGLNKEIDTVQQSLDELSCESTEEAKKYDNIISNIEKLNEFKNHVLELERSSKEISELKSQVVSLENEVGEFGTEVLSISDLQKLQRNKSDEIKKLRKVIDEGTEGRNEFSRELQKLENKVKDTKLNLSNLERSLIEVNNLKLRIAEYNAQYDKLKQQQESINEALSALNVTRTTKQKEVEEFIQRNNIIISEKQSYLDNISKLLSSFNDLSGSIHDFEVNGLENLKSNTEEILQVTNEKNDLGRNIDSQTEQIKVLEKEVSGSSRIEHNIIANIDYRSQLNQLDETNDQLTALDIKDAHIKKQEYQEKSRQLRQEITELTSSHAGKVGEVKQIKDQAKSLQKELETEYKNINENYHEEWIKLQTNMLVSNDIQTYSKALDNAIMKYHSIKMEDINRILGELWSQTYKGSDIATIAIKSDVNLQAKGNRSYNYRVVMYKDENELDMRGRCSAGQKVLASILIRLALAECFGVNCGMIALDEPTTNLDSDNAVSLAEALNNIIEYRKAQSNFQLIIITHDENFLTHINGGTFTDHFYRIQRDENQNSRIYSLPISKIQEN